MAKRALITGVTGQDGSYLTELLLGKGYEVHGMMRRASLFNTDRIDHLYHDPHLGGVEAHLALRRPDRRHRVCAGCSNESIRTRSTISAPRATSRSPSTCRNTPPTWSRSARCGCSRRCAINAPRRPPGALLPGRLVGDVRRRRRRRRAKATPFYPRSPYAVSKVAAHWYAVNYREAYGLFVCNGILFNHESPRRGETFVTRKITRAVGRIQ